MGRLKDWLLTQYETLTLPEPETPCHPEEPEDNADTRALPPLDLEAFDAFMHRLKAQMNNPNQGSQEPF